MVLRRRRDRTAPLVHERRTIGKRYELRSTLGRGGMGLVLLARDSTLERDVAVKLIRQDLLEDRSDAEQMVARFQREAQIGARFACSGLARVYDAGFDETTGDAYIVMELVQGTSLTKVMKFSRRPSAQWIACLMTHLCVTVEHLHRFSIIHRDIKPDNITLGVDGKVILLDLGLARDLGPNAPRITRGNQPLGTPAYMSPEQALGTPGSARTDVYGLGVLLHELIAGITPFVGEPVYLLYAHVHEDPPSLRDLRPDVDPRLCSLASAMLTKHADGRPSVEEVLNQLAEVLPPSGFAHLEDPGFPPLIEPVRSLPSGLRVDAFSACPPPGGHETGGANGGVDERVRRADALYDAGRVLEAFAQYESVAQELGRTIDQPALHCRIRAAQCLAARGEQEAALERFQDVRDDLQSTRGETDHVVLEIRQHVGLLLLAVERLDEAARELAQLYDDMVRVYGRDAEATAPVHKALVALRQRLRNHRSS
ncbi:protein kinase domain-containing protein [Streptomyces sp. enrichment culture]|uniref:protein kinase domain-containing protein n=1 Tax=Streptomyces sp. enrichment culture TaxID=1795815 RepID=UPI003F56DAF2